MRSDLAALIPPLVMAAAFIAGVVALVRREMAPRRRGPATPPEEEADLARGARGGRAAAPGYLQARPAPRSGHRGDDGSADNSARGVAGASGNPDLPGRVDDAAIAGKPEDSPPAAAGS